MARNYRASRVGLSTYKGGRSSSRSGGWSNDKPNMGMDLGLGLYIGVFWASLLYCTLCVALLNPPPHKPYKETNNEASVPRTN